MTNKEIQEFNEKLRRGLELAEKRMLQEKALRNQDVVVCGADQVIRPYIYDNSVDNQLPKLLYRTTDGKPCKRYTDDIPLWAQTIID